MANQTDIDMQDAEYEDGEQENENEHNNDNEANVAEVAKESSESTDDMLVSSAEEKEKLRLAMAAEVEAFLSRGGKIQEVGVNVMADPPRKPQTSYGSRPI
ncbi:MAG: hypothetical protein COA68_14295 [Oceanobacter sp.]|jgi:hypothetical protein|nr:MAG: hypothetical protein COA68_14295 [Oceanobacter sp.]|tara:strand:- start:20220 stop:20522 length:303 start_codon:yes stop_codon:yes gene_type:complete